MVPFPPSPNPRIPKAAISSRTGVCGEKKRRRPQPTPVKRRETGSKDCCHAAYTSKRRRYTENPSHGRFRLFQQRRAHSSALWCDVIQLPAHLPDIQMAVRWQISYRYTACRKQGCLYEGRYRDASFHQMGICCCPSFDHAHCGNIDFCS